MGLWIPLGISNFIIMIGFAEPVEPIQTKPLPHSTGYSASSLQSIKLVPICQIMTLFSFFSLHSTEEGGLGSRIEANGGLLSRRGEFVSL